MPAPAVALVLSLLEFAAVRDWIVNESDYIDYTAGDEEKVLEYTAGTKRTGKNFYFCEVVVGGEIAGRFTIYHDVYENGSLKESEPIATLHISDFDSKWFVQPLPYPMKAGDKLRITFYHGTKSDICA